MSKENVQKFYAFAEENEALKTKLLEAVESGNIVELAKDQGFEFTKGEHDEYLSRPEEVLGELDDDQLDGIAGGIGGLPRPGGSLPGTGSGTLPGTGSGIIPGTKPKQYNVYCPKCGKGFDTMKELGRHAVIAHSGII